MTRTYDFKAIEEKWRPYWREIDLYRTSNDPARPKYYILDFFPYPSGAGLSVGHCRNYVPTCISARFMRMRGYNVLHPMGWDAFGLPAENYAIQHGVHPRLTTSRQAGTYRRQLQLIECSYDWSREINASDPDYYRWTQWFFLLLYRRGLAYRAAGEQWWCPTCQTILANEQVEDGRCWRCGSKVTTKELQQWYFKITAYAERLLADLEHVDWPESIKAMQRHWIGRSEGEDGTGVSYRLHDWLISRQRFWGAPIPIVHCDDCGPVPVPEDELPVRLPDVDDFAPAGDGRSPLARVENWVNTTCPQCGGPAQRETDTMDGFACSSWYFLRFASPHEQERPFDPQAVRHWLPVDTYVGGAEHAVMHLLYARFWTKVMYDAGLIDFQEPFAQLRNQGVLHAPDGRRMSKSRGNVITPDEVVQAHGVDALRTYIVFMGPFDANVTWDEGQEQSGGIRGVTRFLNRFWALAHDAPASHAGPSRAFARQMHRTIRRVTEDMAAFKFNTAVAALMEWANYLQEARAEGVDGDQWREALGVFCRLLAPFAPFITEEVWQTVLDQERSVHCQPWPDHDPALLQAEEVTVAVQVNGRLRDTLTVAADIDETALRDAALASPNVIRHLRDKAVRKTIVVPRQVINLVT